MALRDEILALGMPLDDRGAIAETLSIGRVKVGYVSREKFATWAAKTGMRAKIEDFSIASGHQLRSIALALIDVLRSPTAGIDFSESENVQMLGAWVGAGELAQADADDLLAAATRDDPITSQDVSKAMEGY